MSLDSLRPLRVLLVEDNSINLKFLTMKFNQAGHEVIQAANGKSGLDLLSQDSFDVVLMDVQMPVMDGLEATRRIRSSDDPRVRQTKIIGLTAYAMKDELEHFLEAGMDACISKPVDNGKLAQTIRKVLED